MNDLFEYSARQATRMSRPLAERMRPTHLADYMGQLDAVGEGRLVRRAIEQDKVFSMILWGPPGCGKTTLAKLMAAETSAHFLHFSAVLSGVKEIRSVIKIAEERQSLYRQHTVVEIADIGRLVALEAGEHVFQQGDFGRHIHIIVKGHVTLERTTDLGKRAGSVVIDMLGKGRFLGCWSTLLGEPHILMSSAYCQKPTEIVSIEGVELREMMLSNTVLGMQVMERLCFLLRDRIQAAYGAMEKI